MSFDGQSIAVIGASEGIGLAVGVAAAQAGGVVTLASRSMSKLEKAREQLGDTGAIVQVDANDDQALQAFFEGHGPFDHVVLTVGGRVSAMRFVENPVSAIETAFQEKFWAQFR